VDVFGLSALSELGGCCWGSVVGWTGSASSLAGTAGGVVAASAESGGSAIGAVRVSGVSVAVDWLSVAAVGMLFSADGDVSASEPVFGSFAVNGSVGEVAALAPMPPGVVAAVSAAIAVGGLTSETRISRQPGPRAVRATSVSSSLVGSRPASALNLFTNEAVLSIRSGRFVMWPPEIEFRLGQQ
jgi:hypothetical protein